jgi:hypothetical protein
MAKHIRLIKSAEYTVINTEDYGGEGQDPLEFHPAIYYQGNLYEIADDSELPDYYQYIIYNPKLN